MSEHKRFTDLINVDGYSNDDMKNVTQCQTGDENIGSAPHASVLPDDSQKSHVPKHSQNKHQTRHHAVDVLEGVFDSYGPRAHRK